MRRLSVFFGLGMLTLALLVGAGASQDGKKDTKVKGILPPGFKDLNLTAEQKAAVYTVQAEHRAKIAELNAKIAELKQAESVAVFKVLTPAQREQYLKSKGLGTKDKKSSESEKDKK